MTLILYLECSDIRVFIKKVPGQAADQSCQFYEFSKKQQKNLNNNSTWYKCCCFISRIVGKQVKRRLLQSPNFSKTVKVLKLTAPSNWFSLIYVFPNLTAIIERTRWIFKSKVCLFYICKVVYFTVTRVFDLGCLQPSSPISVKVNGGLTPSKRLLRTITIMECKQAF